MAERPRHTHTLDQGWEQLREHPRDIVRSYLCPPTDTRHQRLRGQGCSVFRNGCPRQILGISECSRQTYLATTQNIVAGLPNPGALQNADGKQKEAWSRMRALACTSRGRFVARLPVYMSSDHATRHLPLSTFAACAPVGPSFRPYARMPVSRLTPPTTRCI